MVSNYSDAGQERWLADQGIDLLRGTGRLAGTGVVEVDGVRHTAEHVVLAAGADPVVPPIPGLRELEGVWTNREVTGMKAVPRRLLVLGGGPVGVEMAQAVRRFGAEVALVEGAEHVLSTRACAAGRGARRGPAQRGHRARARRARDCCAAGGRGLRPGARRRSRAAWRPAARRHRPAPACRRDRPGDGRRRRGCPRGPGRRSPARGRAPVGDRRCQRCVAADPCRQVPGRSRRGQHPRGAARGQLRGRAPGGLHRSAGGRPSARRRRGSPRPPQCPRWRRPPRTHRRTPSPTAS